MKFNEYQYQRPEIEKIKEDAHIILDEFSSAQSIEEQRALIDQINAIRRHTSSMAVLCSIRHTMNTEDAFYESENQYWDENNPYFEELNVQFYQAILSSPFLEELKTQLPETFFKIAEYTLRSFDPIIITDLQEENKLSTQYTKIIASAQIEFDGKIYTLPQLTPFTLSTDRTLRQRALAAKIGFLEENEQTLDEIYDKLVQVRHQIAQKLGYTNFIELGYIRMMRLDYDANMVANFRKQVLSDIVPVANKLYQRQAQRLGLDQLYHYDLKFEFNSGNATPVGDPDFIVEQGKIMYSQLSLETKEFFEHMIEHELMDLVAKKGKAGGGYCTFIADYQSPFIFSNFNGTAGDIDVLTHEAGHAFQVYRSRNIKIPECIFPTMESAEIHSMSMEFFTWPWMENFFHDQAQKYRFAHLSDAIKFIPYGVCVDHFQHEIYAKPHLSPAERKTLWRKLEKLYCPHINYQDSPMLEKGTYWFQQGHIFQVPFYYIDYTLAQICALQFFDRIQRNDESAWKDYLHLCDLGGLKSFTELLKEAHLQSPFEEGCVSSIIKTIDTWLENVDDRLL